MGVQANDWHASTNVATVSDGPPRARGFGPLVGTVGLAAAGVYLAAADPLRGSVYPVCPFHRLTGWWCPGCGMTRALHHLVTGDVVAALAANVLFPVVLVLGGYLWLSWVWPAVTGRPVPSLGRVPSGVWAGAVAVAVVFGVLRNLPLDPFSALAP